LQAADDEAVWNYARDHGFVIVSKDVDFHQRSLVLGAPPKFVWIRRGNCSTDDILALLQKHHPDLAAFEESQGAAILTLG
jgi:predicted nuclease of predicted toxin-antitoxin system